MKRLAVTFALALLLIPAPVLAADSLVALTNADRAGLAPLTEDPTLDGFAQVRADDMLTRNYLSHEIPPDGHHVWDELRTAGYCWSAVGENALMQFRPMTPADVEALFMGSPEHRANIVGAYTRIGVGYAYGADNEVVVDVIFVLPCDTEIVSSATMPPTDTGPDTVDTAAVSNCLLAFWLILFAGYVIHIALDVRR
jgi:hypothetical protein